MTAARNEHLFVNKGDSDARKKKTRTVAAQISEAGDGFAYHFSTTGGRKEQIDFKDSTAVDACNFFVTRVRRRTHHRDKNSASPDDAQISRAENFLQRSAVDLKR